MVRPTPIPDIAQCQYARFCKAMTQNYAQFIFRAEVVYFLAVTFQVVSGQLLSPPGPPCCPLLRVPWGDPEKAVSDVPIHGRGGFSPAKHRQSAAANQTTEHIPKAMAFSS